MSSTTSGSDERRYCTGALLPAVALFVTLQHRSFATSLLVWTAVAGIAVVALLCLWLDQRRSRSSLVVSTLVLVAVAVVHFAVRPAPRLSIVGVRLAMANQRAMKDWRRACDDRARRQKLAAWYGQGRG